MAEFVLDASIAGSWCFPGDPKEDTPYNRRILLTLIKKRGEGTDAWERPCFGLTRALSHPRMIP